MCKAEYKVIAYGACVICGKDIEENGNIFVCSDCVRMIKGEEADEQQKAGEQLRAQDVRNSGK